MQLEVVSDVLPVNIDISTLSALKVVEGNRQIGEIVLIMVYTNYFRSIDR